MDATANSHHFYSRQNGRKLAYIHHRGHATTNGSTRVFQVWSRNGDWSSSITTYNRFHATFDIESKTWYHLRVTRVSNTEYKLYINGIEATYVAQSTDGNSYPVNGAITSAEMVCHYYFFNTSDEFYGAEYKITSLSVPSECTICSKENHVKLNDIAIIICNRYLF